MMISAGVAAVVRTDYGAGLAGRTWLSVSIWVVDQRGSRRVLQSTGDGRDCQCDVAQAS